MGRILLISSWVARGHVGVSAAVPVLTALGVESIALPTIMLSNHPGHRHCAGAGVPIAQLEVMLDAVADNGWLADVAAVSTGYFPTHEHVDFAATAIARVAAANTSVHVCCDPVLGDDPGGLYVGEEVARAIKDRLLPLADSITPNRFELAWLSEQPVESPAEAATAARSLNPALTLATSVPLGANGLANVAVTAQAAWTTASPRRDGVPHGTGDAFAAAFLAALVTGDSVAEALAKASGQIDALIDASAGADELQLTSLRGGWPAAEHVPARALC